MKRRATSLVIREVTFKLIAKVARSQTSCEESARWHQPWKAPDLLTEGTTAYTVPSEVLMRCCLPDHKIQASYRCLLMQKPSWPMVLCDLWSALVFSWVSLLEPVSYLPKTVLHTALQKQPGTQTLSIEQRTLVEAREFCQAHQTIKHGSQVGEQLDCEVG